MFVESAIDILKDSFYVCLYIFLFQMFGFHLIEKYSGLFGCWFFVAHISFMLIQIVNTLNPIFHKIDCLSFDPFQRIISQSILSSSQIDIVISRYFMP